MSASTTSPATIVGSISGINKSPVNNLKTTPSSGVSNNNNNNNNNDMLASDLSAGNSNQNVNKNSIPNSSSSDDNNNNNNNNSKSGSNVPTISSTGSSVVTNASTSSNITSTNNTDNTNPSSVDTLQNQLTEEEYKNSQITLRALMTSKEAGVVIGKGGKNVADLREMTGVKAGVSKPVPGILDRVLTVSGTLESVVKAYSIVAGSLIDSPPSTLQSLPLGVTNICLLISHNQMGTLIGRQGLKIKAIQEACHVRMVASKEMLPQSTERIVEVQGTASAISAAIFEVAKCLVDDWQHSVGTILYNPSIKISSPSHRQSQQQEQHYRSQSSNFRQNRSTSNNQSSNSEPSYFSQSSQKGLSNLNINNHNNQNHHPLFNVVTSASASQPTSVLGAGSSRFFGSTSNIPSDSINYRPSGDPSIDIARSSNRKRGFRTKTNSNTSHIRSQSNNSDGSNIININESSSSPGQQNDGDIEEVQNISIPSLMVGCIIGRGGTRIQEIRRASGARISIAKQANNDSGERLFTIRGTPDANQRALYYLYDQLEQEKARRARESGEISN